MVFAVLQEVMLRGPTQMLTLWLLLFAVNCETAAVNLLACKQSKISYLLQFLPGIFEADSTD